jgi:hypothetical protein
MTRTRASTKPKLLLPAALIAAACSPPQQPKCGTETFHACWPDGGFACPSDCGGLKYPDGGLELDSMGQPQCLC